jgi:hypothetical protein
VECRPCFTSIAIEVPNGIGCGKLAMVYFVAIEVSNHCGMLATCFVLWPSRSQDGTGPAILAMIYSVGIDVPRWN